MLLPISLCVSYLATCYYMYSKYNPRLFLHTKIFMAETLHIHPFEVELWLKVWVLELQYLDFKS